MKKIITYLILSTLITRNYKLRQQGKLPDEWYWADRLVMKWGTHESCPALKEYL